MLTKKRFSVVVVAVATTLVLAACGGGSGASGQAETLTVGSLLAPSSFAVSGSKWDHEANYELAVYDTLLRAAPDGTVVPWLATKWSYDQSKTVLTMTLRDNVSFTDGTKFDAQAAAQNLLRFRKGTASLKSLVANVADAKAVNPTTLQVTLSKPDPSLLHSLTQSPGLMESPKHFDAPDEKTNPVGSGPYLLDAGATVAGSKYVFTKNPHYWAPDDQHYAKVVINVYSYQAAVNAMLGNQINGALIQTSFLKQVDVAGFESKSQQTGWRGLNLYDRNGKLNRALGDVRVRRAIAYAVNRDDMLKTIQGYGTVTGQIFTPNNPGYDAALDQAYPYDPAKAKQLLAEAGYAGGFTLELPAVEGSNASPETPLLVQQLGAVGIKVKSVPAAANDYLPALLAGKFAAVSSTLPLIAGDWQGIGLEVAPNAPWNPFRVQDPTVDNLLHTIQTGADADVKAAAKQLNQYLVDQVWFVPYYRQTAYYAVDKNTDVALQSDNSIPYVYSFRPKA